MNIFGQGTEKFGRGEDAQNRCYSPQPCQALHFSSLFKSKQQKHENISRLSLCPNHSMIVPQKKNQVRWHQQQNMIHEDAWAKVNSSTTQCNHAPFLKCKWSLSGWSDFVLSRTVVNYKKFLYPYKIPVLQKNSKVPKIPIPVSFLKPVIPHCSQLLVVTHSKSRWGRKHPNLSPPSSTKTTHFPPAVKDKAFCIFNLVRKYVMAQVQL